MNDDATLCRRNGWGPGTRLVGDEGYGPTVIEITAVGERNILAKRISHDGKPCQSYESNWTLDLRDWREYVDPDVDLIERMAEAMWKAHKNPLRFDTWETAGHIERDEFRHHARTALAVVRSETR